MPNTIIHQHNLDWTTSAGFSSQLVLSSSLTVCQVTYGSFDYTSLLYLSDYGSDFTGGRFVFMDQNGNRTVEPRAGIRS